MKRRWTISLLLCLVAIAAPLGVKYWPRTVAEEECSALYHKYAKQEGIRATFIRQMQLTDTLRVDLTLLQATDSTGWQHLVEDFDIPPLTPGEQALVADTNTEILLSVLAPDSSFQFEVAAIARQMHCVSIFHVCTESQFNAIVDNHIDQLTTL